MEFEIEGQEFVALNGGPIFKFNEAISFQVYCETQEEVDYYWQKLSEGGDEKTQQCGWLKDKYGVSWQIIPTVLIKMLKDKDTKKSDRVMKVMLQMHKLDMENGRLIVTKATMTCNREQKVRIFATCNCVDKLAPEMGSRFLRFFLKPYTYLEFVTIVDGLAINKYDNTREFAEKVAHNVWFEMGSKDVRDCIKIMKLCKNIEQIDIIAKALKEYSEFGNEAGV